MTSVSSPLPRPTAAQSLGYVLVLALVIAGYSIGLRVIGRLAWSAAVWQAVVCALAAGPILLTVIIGVSIPKKLARYSVTAYNALAPLMLAYQYAFPWVAWSVLIRWMNGGQMASGTAWQSGAAITLFSYVGGAALVLLLRPRPTDIEITRLEIRLPDLPPAFDGYRILHVSDLHAGSRMSLAPTEEKLARASGLSRDLVVFTGDLAARSACIASAAEALANVEAPDGTIAVLGNHDHWIGEDRVARALSERGITVLGNSNLRLTRDGDALWIVGVKDCSYIRRDDFPRALEGVPEDASPVVITHSPDLIYQPESSRAAVVLAGHTHGGQLVFPWIGPLYVPTRLGRRRMSGLLEVDGRRLFINRGLGEVTLPMRLNCPPELALLTLRRRPT
jgi:predicted MPP superfamily phosphohydrolase